MKRWLCFVTVVATFWTSLLLHHTPSSYAMQAPVQPSLEADLRAFVEQEDVAAFLQTYDFRSFDAKVARKKVLGYYVENHAADRLSYQSLTAHQDMVTDVAFVTYNASSDGRLHGKLSERGLKAAKMSGIGSYLLLTNHGQKSFDQQIAHQIITTSQVKQRFLTEVLATVEKHRATGINLDFENIPSADRNAYSQLVAELARLLHQKQKQLIVSVPAKHQDHPRFTWSYAFDYAEIGKYADYVQVMTYDENGPWSQAGPVASYPWVKASIAYAVTQIPSEKILLGIASYGYEWSNVKNRALLYRDIPALAQATNASEQWDDTTKSPTFTYRKNGVTHTVWYENEQSLQWKRSLAEEYMLGGYGVWRLGFEDRRFWQVLVK